jgi:hypothetical protein
MSDVSTEVLIETFFETLSAIVQAFSKVLHY